MRKEFEFYYYNLKDILKYGNFSVKLFNVATLKNIIDTWFSSYIKKEGYYYNGLHVNNLWNLIYAKFQNEFIMKSKKKLNEITPEEIFEAVKEIFIKIQETYPKYDLLLSKLAEENLDLFSSVKNKLTSDGNSKFNDTPQIEGGYEGDEYASNYTQNHSETISENDVNTIMMRISEVDSNYKNILDEWASSFFELFIEEANIHGEDIVI